jgi:hypothetical protein
MPTRHLLILWLCVVSAPTLAANDIDRINLLTQAEFRALSGDLSAAVSYKAVIPIEPLGLTGFDIGLEASATKIQNRAAFESATSASGSAPSTIYVPKLHIHKGLPAGIDLGAFYATAADTNIKVWGAEIRYALIKGGVAVPAVGLRGTYSKLSGVNQLDLNTKGLELGISKGFAFFTPYAGIGRIWTHANPLGVSNVQSEKFSENKTFVGANFNFGIGNFALEADKTGDTTSYSAKFGFRF